MPKSSNPDCTATVARAAICFADSGGSTVILAVTLPLLSAM
jgi:hypothetical protein